MPIRKFALRPSLAAISAAPLVSTGGLPAAPTPLPLPLLPRLPALPKLPLPLLPRLPAVPKLPLPALPKDPLPALPTDPLPLLPRLPALPKVPLPLLPGLPALPELPLPPLPELPAWPTAALPFGVSSDGLQLRHNPIAAPAARRLENLTIISSPNEISALADTAPTQPREQGFSIGGSHHFRRRLPVNATRLLGLVGIAGLDR